MTAIDVLFGTNLNLEFLLPYLQSIARQTMQPARIVMLIYTALSEEEEHHLRNRLQQELPEMVFSILEIITVRDARYTQGQGVAYDRHFLVEQSTSDYIYMIDHDNVFDETLFEKSRSRYQKLSAHFKSDLILSPTIYRNDKKHIQSQGITGIRYRFPKYEYRRIPADEDRQQVMMIGANSLFGPRRLFQKFQFDTRFSGSYEDVDFTRRLTRAGYPLIVVKELATIHKEGERSFLQTRFLHTPRSAYLRGRNRIRFIKKTATRRQKVQYFGLGLRIQTVGFTYRIFRFGGKERWEIVKALRRGTRAGLWNE